MNSVNIERNIDQMLQEIDEDEINHERSITES
jgi:hypothetical protein